MALSGLVTPTNSAFAEGGFFLRILPDSANEWSNNSKLWVVAVPGEKAFVNLRYQIPVINVLM